MVWVFISALALVYSASFVLAGGAIGLELDGPGPDAGMSLTKPADETARQPTPTDGEAAAAKGGVPAHNLIGREG